MEEIRSISNSSRQDQERHVSFDATKDMHSPRFRAVIRATSGKKRHSIKSFSHEMNSKGAQRYLHRKVRGLNFSQVKFTRLKEDVNCELKVFAGELVELLEITLDSHPEWRTTIEDLLVNARETAEMSPDEFRKNCEAIVQKLDDTRLALPSGTLKKIHTRMLFILTRCTRMLQFQNEAEADHVLNFHQRSDLGVYPGPGEAAIYDHCTNIRPVNVGKQSIEQPVLDDIHNISDIGSALSSDSPGSRERISSWKKLPSAAEKNMKKDSDEVVSLPSKDMPDFLSSLENLEKDSTEQTGAQIVAPEKQEDFSSDADLVMICRICDLKIPKLYVEEHSRICTIADRCDCKGLSVDERLERVAEILEKILEACTPKQLDTNAKNLETAGEISEEYEILSPDQSIALHPSSTDEMKHFPIVINTLRMNDLKILPPMWCNTQCATTPEPGTKASSMGSMTPLSLLSTPRAYQVDSLLLGPCTFPELENFQQMHDLLDIVHCILNIESKDYESLQYLHSYLEYLQEVVNEKKVDALIVETFGTRIEKLLQEKYTLILLQIDEGKVDRSCTLADEDNVKKSNNVHGTQTTAICSKFKDRTTIEDFEIIKPISRGAFGRVFLAKKRITGDQFAIKVLKKTDMIRKNAVESILAERDILISVRNPFVVRFYYSFTCSENLYLVMEYLNGGDLYSLLRSLGCLEEDMARTYIAEVVLALEYLHSLNVIHRDLKPDNLLINHDGHIKLTDFGLSKVGLINSTDDLSGPDSSSLVMLTNCEQEVSKELRMQKREQRQRQCVVGTPDYLAPEILLGMPHGRSVDWWSVGIILFELLVGIPPFNAEHPQKIFDNIMNRDIPWPLVPEEMSFEAYDLINKLLIENPMQRLGATGSSEVKCHPFFSNINWDMLAKQKAAFIPSTEGENDTSYFICRHQWTSTDAQVNATFNDSDGMSDTCSMSSCSTPCGYEQDEEGDKCCKLAEFGSSNLSVNYSFSNFSFKNLSRLASINYDFLKKDNNEELPSNPQSS